MPLSERSTRRLIAIAITASLVWLVVLPWIARWEVVERHLQLLEERQIDASAMFYTELEARPAQAIQEPEA
jgi:hypothetical protein